MAERLRAEGHDSVVPSLLDVARADSPFWPHVVEDVNAAMNDLDPDRPVLLVVHSNAGLFVPLLITHAVRPVRGCVFIDAALLVASGATPVAPPELLDMLRAKTDEDGLLPPGLHLHQLVDPDSVTAALIDMTGQLPGATGR